MKRCFFRCFAWLAVAFSVTHLAGCRPEEPVASPNPIRYVVGLSPFLDEESGNEVFRQIVHLLLEDLPLNSSLWLYDAYHVRTIAKIDVPNVRAFESSRTRANQFSKPIQQLKSFLAADHATPEVEGLDFQHALQFPQFMDFIGENLVQTNAVTVAIVLGSPLYLDEKEPGFSMVNGYFPSDGHLTASREQSVYGRKDCGALLNKLTVHYGFFGDPWDSDLHRQKVGRFWNLFLKSQGAQLATFTADLPTIFNTLRSDPLSSGMRSVQDEIDPTQSKIEMLRITRDAGSADWITRDLPADYRALPPTREVGPMKIGIRWQGDLDLDLYAQARPDAQRLFFQQTQSPEGYYYKDHRSSPDREYEFIEYTEPVSVREVQAMVNFYEGRRLGGVEGEIRIEFQGRIYTSRFELSAEAGNLGREGDSQRAWWTPVDIPATLGLRE